MPLYQCTSALTSTSTHANSEALRKIWETELSYPPLPGTHGKGQVRALKNVTLFLSSTYLGVIKKPKRKIIHRASWEILGALVFNVVILLLKSSVFCEKVGIAQSAIEGF